MLAVVPGSTELPRSAAPARPRRRAGTARRATSTARRRPSSRSRTATSGQNAPYAQIAKRYAAAVRLRRRRRWPRSPSTSATNACAHPDAVFHGKPITVEDVLASPMIADPIHMLETVMRVQGGAGVLIANADLAARCRHRPVWVKGFGEHISFKTPTYADDLMLHPGRPRRRRGVRDGRAARRPTSTSPRSTTATRSPC